MQINISYTGFSFRHLLKPLIYIAQVLKKFLKTVMESEKRY